MELNKAIIISQEIIETLNESCDRIEIAGSVRRQKAEVKDIEIICIHTMENENGLFSNEYSRSPKFGSAISRLGLLLKGKPMDNNGRYIQIEMPLYNIKVDIFIGNEENWGLLKVIRTGPARFSKFMMVACQNAGYKCEKMQLINLKTNESIPVRSERAFFHLVNVDFVEPNLRV